jgi:signal transduction histidine kinase
MQARYEGAIVLPQAVRASESAPKSEGLPLGQLRRFWSLSALYDGQSTEGQLLDERTWAKQLARRSDLRAEQGQLMLRLESTAMLANRLCWRVTVGVPLCVLLLMIGGFVYTYMQHRQQVRRVRNQLAADLHDDLGSNLSAIAAYTSQLRRRLVKTIGEESLPLELPPLERLTRECLGSLKEMVSVTAPQITKHVPLVDRLRDVADIHRAGLPLAFEVSPECEHWDIQQAKRRSLRLFLKEALNNIIRHSGASSIQIRLGHEQGERYWLRICDDGCGLSEEALEAFRDGSTLRYRANELESDFEVRNLASGGLEVAVAIPDGAVVIVGPVCKYTAAHHDL